MNKKNPRTNQLRQLFNYLLNLDRVTSEGSRKNVSINLNCIYKFNVKSALAYDPLIVRFRTSRRLGESANQIVCKNLLCLSMYFLDLNRCP
jgi:hypothetical protein